MITLEGLSQQQAQIAEMLWKCNSIDDVDRWNLTILISYCEQSFIIGVCLVSVNLTDCLFSTSVE
jgi:hypothetical protein